MTSQVATAETSVPAAVAPAPGAPTAGRPAPRRGGRGGWVRSFGGNFLLKLVPAIAFFGFWQWWANARGSLLVPNATETLSALWDLVRDGATWDALWISNQSLLAGFGAAVLLGIPSGLLMGRVRAIEKIADVWLNILVVLPMAMLMPIIIMSLGFDLRARALVVMLFAYPMVAVNTRAGVREVPTDLIEMARLYGANERKVWQKILINAASPAIWTGLRIGLGRAITGMVLAELLLVSVGVGRLLQIYKGRFQPENTYALVVLVVAESLVLMSLVRRLERVAVPWATKDNFANT